MSAVTDSTVPCEGSGHPPILTLADTCPVCDTLPGLDDDGALIDHGRDPGRRITLGSYLARLLFGLPATRHELTARLIDVGVFVAAMTLTLWRF